MYSSSGAFFSAAISRSVLQPSSEEVSSGLTRLTIIFFGMRTFFWPCLEGVTGTVEEEGTVERCCRDRGTFACFRASRASLSSLSLVTSFSSITRALVRFLRSLTALTEGLLASARTSRTISACNAASANAPCAALPNRSITVFMDNDRGELLDNSCMPSLWMR